MVTAPDPTTLARIEDDLATAVHYAEHLAAVYARLGRDSGQLAALKAIQVWIDQLDRDQLGALALAAVARLAATSH